MIADRRKVLHLIGAGGGSYAMTKGAFAATPHPVLWRIEKGGAVVHILGFADANDRSWLTPAIERAFRDSTEAWFEVPQRDPSAPPPQAAASSPGPPPGYSEQSLFDTLSPALAARVLAAARKYDVSRESLEHVRVWRAYFVLNSGYLSKNPIGAADLENFPDIVLSQMAYKSGKTVHSEFATGAETMAHFVNMPEAEARERLEFLLDFYDDDTAGRLSDRFDWISGRSNTRAIDRMRIKWPALYQDEQVSRNVGWARRIQGFLDKGGTYFVVIGLQHTLGPDSMIVQLRKIGLTPLAT
jgi:uncharacterized protein YbaP (TraB family)